MCCFSVPVAEVSGTSIFARFAGDRQLLAYQMRVSSPEDVAMILPLPTDTRHGEGAVEFIDLSEAPDLFEQLGLCFWQPSRSFGAVAVAGGPAATLQVHRVGAFDASFVPAVADFARLDPRFRLPDAVLDRVPAYGDYGFAVFRLRKGEAEVHPLALRFITRAPDRLFYPTVHVHDGGLPDKAVFDHMLYLQSPDLPQRSALQPSGWQKALRPVRDVVKLGNILHRDPTRGLIESGWPLYRLQIEGTQPNRDTWVSS
jgi:hypothetical protein